MPENPLPFYNQYSQMLFNLKLLTTLKLSWYTSDTNFLGFYESIGNSCPQLSVLELNNFAFGMPEIDALFLGPLNFTPTLSDLAKLNFFSETLTPIIAV